jgi:hypothetical protein
MGSRTGNLVRNDGSTLRMNGATRRLQNAVLMTSIALRDSLAGRNLPKSMQFQQFQAFHSPRRMGTPLLV